MRYFLNLTLLCLLLFAGRTDSNTSDTPPVEYRGDRTTRVGLMDDPAKVDYWQLDDVNKEMNSGPWRDCEWFTHFKQKKLKELGIDSQKLYVRTENGDPEKDEPNHVVVQVGDWILDNRQHRVMSRQQMLRGGYKEYPGYTIPVPSPQIAK